MYQQGTRTLALVVERAWVGFDVTTREKVFASPQGKGLLFAHLQFALNPKVRNLEKRIV